MSDLALPPAGSLSQVVLDFGNRAVDVCLIDASAGAVNNDLAI